MKAISIYRPWSMLIAWGEKEYETRHWKPYGMQKGDSIAIHSTKKFAPEDVAICDKEPFASALKRHDVENPESMMGGAIVCICQLIAVWKSEDIRDGLTVQERAFGNYQNGRYAWQLKVVYVFDEPIPVRGGQGLWEWEIPVTSEDEPEDEPPSKSSQQLNSTIHMNGGETPAVLISEETIAAHFNQVRDQWNVQTQRFDDDRIVYCGRKNAAQGLPESPWHNPFKLQTDTSTERKKVLEQYRAYIVPKIAAGELDIEELRGKVLTCWCKPKECHCDVLIELLPKFYTLEYLSTLKPPHPEDNATCLHCGSSNVRFIWKHAYEVHDYRPTPMRKWLEGEMAVGCMKCLKHSLIVRKEGWSKEKVPARLYTFWHTQRYD